MSLDVFAYVLFGVVMGLGLGVRLEAHRWRSKGDHEYMNLIESGGSLYTVKREMADHNHPVQP